MFSLRSVSFAAPFLLAAAVAAPGRSPDTESDRTHPAPAAQQTGRQIFEAICAQCHSVQPPAKQAPPMSHVARHYLTEIVDRDQAIERVAAWIRQPARDRSLLDDHAIDMWGVMPPLALADEQAHAVADYVVSLADSAVGAMGHGRMMGRDSAGMRRGKGMGRGMMGRDTSGMTRGMGMGMGRGMMGGDTTGMTRGMGRGMMGRDTTGVRGRRRGGISADTMVVRRRFHDG